MQRRYTSDLACMLTESELSLERLLSPSDKAQLPSPMHLTPNHALILTNRNLLTSGLDSGSSWSGGVNGILMQQEPNLPKQDYWNQRAIASLANTLITVVEPVPMPLLSSMLLLQL